MAKGKEVERITRIIERRLGWTNGWAVNDERFRELCRGAAKSIMRSLSSRKERKQ